MPCRRAVQAVALLLCFAAPVPAGAPVLEPLGLFHGQAPAKPLVGPRGIALDARRGEVVVANSGAHVVETYDLAGRLLARYVHRVRDAGGRLVDGCPTGVAVDAAGHTLIVDRLAAYVDVLDLRGAAVARLDLGAEPGGGATAVAVIR